MNTRQPLGVAGFRQRIGGQLGQMNEFRDDAKLAVLREEMTKR